jgi:hypothetical protein
VAATADSLALAHFAAVTTHASNASQTDRLNLGQTQPDVPIRLAVEGGGQVRAELVAVGQSGEQSLKRTERAGDRASDGLKGLGRQAGLLRGGIRPLDGARRRDEGRRPRRRTGIEMIRRVIGGYSG